MVCVQSEEGTIANESHECDGTNDGTGSQKSHPAPQQLIHHVKAAVRRVFREEMTTQTEKVRAPT